MKKWVKSKQSLLFQNEYCQSHKKQQMPVDEFQQVQIGWKEHMYDIISPKESLKSEVTLPQKQ